MTDNAEFSALIMPLSGLSPGTGPGQQNVDFLWLPVPLQLICFLSGLV